MRFEPVPAEPVLLDGDAHTRGLAQVQVAGCAAEAVRRAIGARLSAERPLLHARSTSAFLDRQAECLQSIDPEGAAELAGIADGFGMRKSDLLAYLHVGIVADMADGCSAWAYRSDASANLLVKNRDYRREHATLQRVFLHRSPERPGWDVLCVGSIGSPGAFSSGMNIHGLSLVDTQVGTSDHGHGLLRYFLMTRLLWRTRTVKEALSEIARVPHAGGGTVVLADATGQHAVVELGHAKTAADTAPSLWRARTNHFLLPGPREHFRAAASDRMALSSSARLAHLENSLRSFERPPSPADAATLMASHSEGVSEGLCRHGEDGDSLTISTSIFAPTETTLYFAPQNPCANRWLVYRLTSPL